MEQLIKEYIENIDEYTINKYAKMNNINLTDQETKVIYMYLKNYWQVFYKGNPTELFKELKEQLQEENYQKILQLYNKYKEKII